MEPVLTKNFLLFYILCLGSFAQAIPRIVEPYPNNVYAIENEKTKVTCVVEDKTTNPNKIVFVRKTRFGDVLPIYDQGPDGRYYYENKTLDNGSKLQVTLHFNNVTLNDDSREGGYECQGYTGAQHHEYGFTVTVIELAEFPEVHVSNNLATKFGNQIELSCNVTIKKASMTTLSKFIWEKDGTPLVESYCPTFSIKPLVMNVSRPDVGGIYTCYLEYKLRNIWINNITKHIAVKVQPNFFPEEKEVKNVIKLVCSAQGNPLVTEWKKKAQQDDKMVVLNTKDNSSRGKYVFSNMNGLKDHTLTIYDVQQQDRGQYYCCIEHTNITRSPENVEGCQTFNLAPTADSSAGKVDLQISLILLGFTGLLYL